MNEQPKSKLMVLVIGALLLANVVLLSILLLRGQHQKGPNRERNDKAAFIGDYLKNEVGFNASQMATYDSLSKKHRLHVKEDFKTLANDRKTILAGLSAASFTDSAIAAAAMALHNRQQGFELSMLQHVRDIRNICTNEQRATFDTGFYKIFGRRGEQRKEK